MKIRSSFVSNSSSSSFVIHTSRMTNEEEHELESLIAKAEEEMEGKDWGESGTYEYQNGYYMVETHRTTIFDQFTQKKSSDILWLNT